MCVLHHFVDIVAAFVKMFLNALAILSRTLPAPHSFNSFGSMYLVSTVFGLGLFAVSTSQSSVLGPPLTAAARPFCCTNGPQSTAAAAGMVQPIVTLFHSPSHTSTKGEPNLRHFSHRPIYVLAPNIHNWLVEKGVLILWNIDLCSSPIMILLDPIESLERSFFHKIFHTTKFQELVTWKKFHRPAWKNCQPAKGTFA